MSTAGRRPGGAVAKPCFTNHRCSARTEGTTFAGIPWSKSTRIRPAPQVGCSRRSLKAAWTASGGSTGTFVGRWYDGSRPSLPLWRNRARSRRTVELASPSEAAISWV
jgi:hypothetical protein